MNLFAFLARAAVTQLRVLRTILVRDTRTRFGGKGGSFTYLVAIGLPLGHLLCLMLVPIFLHPSSPIGSEFAVFAATGVLPYILSLYPSRMMMLCLNDNAPLLQFPIVRPPDLIMARAAMEIVVALTVAMILLLLLYVANYEVVPVDSAEATAAIFSAIYFGVSVGFVSAVLLRLTPAWMFIQIGTMLSLYVSSGAFFLVRNLPASVRELISYNPLFHCVEWLRLAYFAGYGDEMLSRQYLLGVSTALVLFGMLLERLVRPRLLVT